MRQIQKTNPPDEFIEYCKTPGVCFEGLTGDKKKSLRKRLLEDQGYICCYCGRSIKNDEHTKIEHIRCQENYRHLELDFNNMLVSCDGGDKDRSDGIRPRHQVHCDAKKGNRDIPISPLENTEGLLFFFDDGTVKGNGDTGKALVEILGLDAKFLNTQRRNAIEQYKDFIPADLDLELLRLREKKDGCYNEFCFVLEQHIMDLINERNVGVMEVVDTDSGPLEKTEHAITVKFLMDLNIKKS